jgi:hypothetical protein
MVVGAGAADIPPGQPRRRVQEVKVKRIKDTRKRKGLFGFILLCVFFMDY